jgi:drug/metabolite transporter (DMT)-like permease
MGIIIGTYIIGMEKWNITLFAPFISLWKNPASRIYLVSIVCYGFVVTIDQIWVRQSSFWFWTFCMNIAVVMFCLPSMIQNRRDFIENVRSSYFALWWATVLHALVYGVQIYLLAYIQAPYLSAFKTSSALFSVILGGWFFRESHLLKRTLGALLITIGIIGMSFYW